MFVVEWEVVHSKDHAYEVTKSLSSDSQSVVVTCVEEMSTGINAFILGDIRE